MKESKRTLSKKQRDWVVERDGGQCMFHSYFHKRGLVRCTNTTDLHVHHIKPHRWLGAQFNVIIETPYNLLTLCKTHHFNFIHPDMKDALRRYHAEKAKGNNAIARVFALRKAKVDDGIPYWVQRWDQFFKFLAKESTNAYSVPWP